MNTRRRKVKFKNFQILLDIGCSSTIVMRRLIIKLKNKEDSVIQFKTQALNITTDIKVKI